MKVADVRRFAAFVLVASAAALVGCSRGEPGRLRLSGEATFDGKPIPYGDVVFTPDGTQNNSGPQGIAQIRDGRYDTSAAGGKGFAGGPTLVRVTGLSGQGGPLLCEYEYRADLPRTDGTHAIEVPKKDGVKRPKPSGI